MFALNIQHSSCWFSILRHKALLYVTEMCKYDGLKNYRFVGGDFCSLVENIQNSGSRSRKQRLTLWGPVALTT